MVHSDGVDHAHEHGAHLRSHHGQGEARELSQLSRHGFAQIIEVSGKAGGGTQD